MALLSQENRDKYFEDVDPHELSEEQMQVLSPRRKILVELERVLDVDIPATRKTHKGRDWKKDSPNIANEDLYAIARGIFQEARRIAINCPDATS